MPAATVAAARAATLRSPRQERLWLRGGVRTRAAAVLDRQDGYAREGDGGGGGRGDRRSGRKGGATHTPPLVFASSTMVALIVSGCHLRPNHRHALPYRRLHHKPVSGGSPLAPPPPLPHGCTCSFRPACCRRRPAATPCDDTSVRAAPP